MELDKRFELLPFCCLNAERCEKIIDNWVTEEWINGEGE